MLHGEIFLVLLRCCHQGSRYMRQCQQCVRCDQWPDPGTVTVSPLIFATAETQLNISELVWEAPEISMADTNNRRVAVAGDMGHTGTQTPAHPRYIILPILSDIKSKTCSLIMLPSKLLHSHCTAHVLNLHLQQSCHDQFCLLCIDL